MFWSDGFDPTDFNQRIWSDGFEFDGFDPTDLIRRIWMRRIWSDGFESNGFDPTEFNQFVPSVRVER